MGCAARAAPKATGGGDVGGEGAAPTRSASYARGRQSAVSTHLPVQARAGVHAGSPLRRASTKREDRTAEGRGGEEGGPGGGKGKGQGGLG